jgi:hypothetical protein
MGRVLDSGNSGGETEFENNDRLKKEAFHREQNENSLVVNSDKTASGATQSKIVNLE